MFARLNDIASAAFFNVGGGDLTDPLAIVLSPSGTETEVTLTPVASAPDVWITPTVLFDEIGTYVVYFKDGSTVLRTDEVQVAYTTTTAGDQPYTFFVSALDLPDSPTPVTYKVLNDAGEVTESGSASYVAGRRAYSTGELDLDAGYYHLLWYSGGDLVKLSNVPILLEKSLASVTVRSGYVDDAGESTPNTGAFVIVSLEDGTFVSRGLLDSTGMCYLSILPGSYVFTLFKEGVSYDNNNVIATIYSTYSQPLGNLVHILAKPFTALVEPRVPPTATCNLHTTIYGFDGKPMPFVTVFFRIVGSPMSATAGMIVGRSFEVLSDQNGYISLSVLRGAEVEMVVAGAGLRRIFTVPDEDEADVSLLHSSGTDPLDIQSMTISALERRSV